MRFWGKVQYIVIKLAMLRTVSFTDSELPAKMLCLHVT